MANQTRPQYMVQTASVLRQAAAEREKPGVVTVQWTLLKGAGRSGLLRTLSQLGNLQVLD